MTCLLGEQHKRSIDIEEVSKTMLSKQAIEEFQKLYQETFGTELSFAEATEQASQLLKFYKIVLETPLSNKASKDLSHE